MTRQSLRRRPHPLHGLAALLVAGLVLVGCAPAAPAPGADAAPTVVDASEILSDFGLAGLDAAAVIERLDTMPVAERNSELIASVRPDAVILTAGERQASLPLTGDEVYISVAPYLTQTHECYFHSLTTCLGELQNATLQLTLTDNASGEVLINEQRETFDNGFVGFWVPRGIEATLTMEIDGRTSSGVISTLNADDPTCITTQQLA